jgi:hypothetical protein
MKIISYDSDKLREMGEIVVPQEIPSETLEKLHPIHAAILQNIQGFEPRNIPEGYELVVIVGIKENTEEEEYWQCDSWDNRIYLEVGMLHLCRSWIQVWLCSTSEDELRFTYKLTDLFVGRMHGCIENARGNGHIDGYLRDRIQRGRDACLTQSRTEQEKHCTALDVEKVRVQAIFPIQA